MFSLTRARLNQPVLTNSLKRHRIPRRYFSHQRVESEWRYYGKRALLAFGVFGISLYVLKQVADKYIVVHWPVRVKANAKAALLASRRGDTREAMKFGSRAWLACLEADPKDFGPNPYLTISGIALMYASKCIEGGKNDEAFEPLSKAYELMFSRSSELSDTEKVRVIGLATKLAEYSEEAGKDDLAEKWYEKAVVNTLKWFKVPLPPPTFSVPEGVKGVEETIIFPTLVPTISGWLFDHSEKEHLKPDPSAPFVNLARLYSRQGRAELAIPTFSYAIQIKSSPTGPKQDLAPTTEDKCSAALLMAEVSEVLLRVYEPPPQEDGKKKSKISKEYKQAQIWAERGYEIAEKYIKLNAEMGERVGVCEEACAAASLCLAAFHERIEQYEHAAGAYKRVLDLPDNDNLDLSLPKSEASAGLERVIELHKSKKGG